MNQFDYEEDHYCDRCIEHVVLCTCRTKECPPQIKAQLELAKKDIAESAKIRRYLAMMTPEGKARAAANRNAGIEAAKRVDNRLRKKSRS